MSKDDGGRITISGGTFAGSAIGIGKVTVNNGDVQQVTVDDLRSALAGGRQKLLDAAPDETSRARVATAVEELQEELEVPEPDGDVVRGGWKRVLRLLDGGAKAAESIATITELVSSLFGS
ncbi:hypothetical protein GCM10009836_48520 [Pseudonocardia ailaonensis]|uniref:Uncharacterized protein n=1 Tax=Pseudonocardia ailaonensis TaxID=367279 RepID=A0ABN2NC50_9PSEU